MIPRVVRPCATAFVTMGLQVIASGMLCPPAAAPAPIQSKDVIVCKGGESIEGRVERETYRNVEVAYGRGMKRTIAWEDVVSVDFAGSERFEAAMEDLSAGRIDAAAEAFRTLTKDVPQRRPLLQESLFELARLEQRRRHLDDAIKGYRSLLKGFPDGRHLDEAAEGLVDCLLQNGDTDEALRTLDEVAQAADGARVGALFAVTEAALRGRILQAKRSFADARDAYAAALSSGRLDDVLAAKADLGIARCLLADGKVADARTRLRAITTREAPHSVLAGAWNELADLALDEGVAKRDQDRILVALYSYLRGVVLYLPEPGEATEEHERAITGAASAFDYLAQLEADPKAKRMNRWRAEELRRRLRR